LLNAALSMLLAVLSALAAVGIMQLLVTKDFFLPSLLRLARRIPLTEVWAATWILAVIGTTLVTLLFVVRRILPALARLSLPTPARDLRAAWISLGPLARIVVMILFILSVYSFGVMIDRLLKYNNARKQSRLFVQQVAGALKDGKLDEAIAIAERNKKSHIAKVVATGLSELRASQLVSDKEVVETAKRGLERSMVIVHAEMRRGLSALATIGSTAPFVGLFGTVVGILNAFKAINANQATGLSAFAGGIAEALATTAFGLLVAVPAVWAYNYLTNKAEAYDIEISNSWTQLSDYFINRAGKGKK
jgi:biopolymer transport protein ExbB